MDSDNLQSHQARTTYLVTYSQADTSKFPTREKFANVVVDAFNHEKKFNRVVQWACSKEKHENGGVHYHLALKLNDVYRWKQVKESVTKSHGIVIHFRNFTSGYYDAYNYTIKKDKKFIVSEGHSAVLDTPQTMDAMAARSSQASLEGPIRPPKRPKKLDMCDLYDTTIENNIKTDEQLCQHALKEKGNGNKQIANFVLAKDEKRRSSILSTAWKMQNSSATLARKSKSRIEILEDAHSIECIPNCGGKWYAQAEETLKLNQVCVEEFCAAVKNLLENGRGKGRNIMLVGPSNCGKTFMLKPLAKIFQCFQSPTTGTFNWVGAEKAECVFLNDFRWSEKVIPWSDLLNLCEGEKVQIPVPKTHFTENVVWTADTPVFATSKSRIIKLEDHGRSIDEVDTKMMDNRWTTFKFRHQFTKANVVEISPCPHCFASLILLNC